MFHIHIRWLCMYINDHSLLQGTCCFYSCYRFEMVGCTSAPDRQTLGYLHWKEHQCRSPPMQKDLQVFSCWRLNCFIGKIHSHSKSHYAIIMDHSPIPSGWVLATMNHSIKHQEVVANPGAWKSDSPPNSENARLGWRLGWLTGKSPYEKIIPSGYLT